MNVNMVKKNTVIVTLTQVYSYEVTWSCTFPMCDHFYHHNTAIQMQSKHYSIQL